MKVFRTIVGLKKFLRANKTYGAGLVPTMGALHEGHITLIKRSVKENDITVVSIFVNPAQFGPGEDFRKYPRTEKDDISKCRASGADAVFIPGSKHMYPEGFNTYVEAAGLDRYLCGASRPGHFRGVTTVVAKLFNIVEPCRAYFGKKDFQQLAIIKKMVKDLNFNIKVVECPTIRDENGLALSSRNKYLSQSQKASSAFIYKALKKVKFMIEYEKLSTQKQAFKAFAAVINSVPGLKIDYFLVVGNSDLQPADKFDGSLTAACAVFSGAVRLIDNISIKA